MWVIRAPPSSSYSYPSTSACPREAQVNPFLSSFPALKSGSWIRGWACWKGGLPLWEKENTAHTQCNRLQLRALLCSDPIWHSPLALRPGSHLKS